MKYFILFLILLFIVVVIILFLKIKIRLSYEHTGKGHDFIISLTILGFIKYKIPIPANENSSETTSSFHDQEESVNDVEDTIRSESQHFIQIFENINRQLIHIIGYHTILKKFLKKVSIHEFQWRTTLGAGDAALTGSFSGILWGIKGNITGLLVTYFLVEKEPEFVVEPKFDQLMLNTSFSCILSFRTGHAIFAGIKMIDHFKKGKLIFSRKAEEPIGRNMNV